MSTNEEKKGSEAVKIHPSDDPFAFGWEEIPEELKEVILGVLFRRFNLMKHSSPYGGYEKKQEICESIFKTLVARDTTIRLPYVDSVTERSGIVQKSFQREYYDEETATIKTEPLIGNINSEIKTVFRVLVPNDLGGYEELRNVFGNEGRHATFEKACDAAIDYAWDVIGRHIDFPLRKIEDVPIEIRRLEQNDWAIRGKTFSLTKALLIARTNDWKMKDVCEEFGLSKNPDNEFIDWIANGCIVPAFKDGKAHLDSDNAKEITNVVDFGWLGRGDIVENFHGIEYYDLEKMKVGTEFSAKRNGRRCTFIVFEVGYDEDTKLVAYAPKGLSVDQYGRISEDEIEFGIDSGLVEASWDALFDVNRCGKRKKFLRSVKLKEEK